jgi:hypothetical protein
MASHDDNKERSLVWRENNKSQQPSPTQHYTWKFGLFGAISITTYAYLFTKFTSYYFFVPNVWIPMWT